MDDSPTLAVAIALPLLALGALAITLPLGFIAGRKCFDQFLARYKSRKFAWLIGAVILIGLPIGPLSLARDLSARAALGSTIAYVTLAALTVAFFGLLAFLTGMAIALLRVASAKPTANVRGNEASARRPF